MLGRAQGWRFAPPPPAASALTPSAHRAFWHPSGRRDAPPGGRAKARSCGGSRRRVPGLIAREHRVEDDDQLAHAGDEGDLGFLAPGAQALVVGLEHRVVLGGGAHDRHIEEVAELAASALDVARAFALAAVVVVGRGADEGGGGLVADAPEFGQPGDQAGDRLIAEPRHALDDFGPSRERRVGLDLGGDGGVELAQLGPHRLGDRGQGLGDDGRRAMLALLSDPPFQLFQGRARLDQPVDLLARGIVRLGPRRRETSRRTRRSSRRRSDRSWPAARPLWRSGESASDRRSGPRRRPRAGLPPSSAHNRRSPPSPPGRPGSRAATRPTGPAFRGVRRRQAQPRRADAGVDFALCDIEADNNSRLLWHPPLPSLLVRAPRPCNCSGLRKTPDLSLASPQVPPLVATGSDPATGGWLDNRPFATLSQFADTRPLGIPTIRDQVVQTAANPRVKPWSSPGGCPADRWVTK